MTQPSLVLGQRIELNDGRAATIRFFGQTTFQTGDWVGVELDEATGKNDGAVKGERYFECEVGYGMFLRPAGVRQVLDAPSKQNAAGKEALNSRSRSAFTGLKRQNMAETPGRRTSTLASPMPAGRTMGGMRSPARSPTKQLGLVSTNGSASTSRTNSPPAAGKRPQSNASAKPRPSLAPAGSAAGRRASVVPPATAPTSRTARPPFAAPAASARASPAAREAPVRTASGGLQPPQRQLPGGLPSSLTEDGSDRGSQRSGVPSLKNSSAACGDPSEQIGKDGEEEEGDDTVQKSFAPPPVPSPRLQRRTSSPQASITSQRTERTVRSGTAAARQIEELEARNRLLERKRQDDREVKNTLDKTKQERDRFESMIQKITMKYQPLQAENAALKKSVQVYESRFADIEAIQAEHDSIMEMATLDREMAEETAEGLKTEMDALHSKTEELALEAEVLRDENEELNKPMSQEERNSTGWLQMEKTNERLREALLRLRDVTQDQETELRAQLKSLETQVKDLEPIRAQHQDTKEKLFRTQADNEDLRQQLEAALSAEDMIEELTERNLNLQENMDELRATVSDLEDLRELNDELEVNHVEAEKQMQEEIDFKESLLVDREKTARQQQDALEETQYTITRFRTLVNALETDLTNMQASKQISEHEAKELGSKSRAMLDLNLKLQTSARKTQVKTLDLELRKLEAQEASEHLAIVQLFLPEAFHAERDSVLGLLRFKRIGFKANLIHGFVKERIASYGSRGAEEDVFTACDVLDKLVWIAAMAERFVNSICSCSPTEFARYDGALYELEPVERALNSYIDALRREELKERAMAEELARSMEVISHLASIHIKSDDLPSQADEVMMRISCLQSQLESTASALSILRTMVHSNVIASVEEDEGYEDDEPSDLALILDRADVLTSHARSAKVMAGKSHRALADLEARSLTLETSCVLHFVEAEMTASAIAAYSREAGRALQTLFGEEGRPEPFVSAEVTATLNRAAQSALALSVPEAGPFAALSAQMRSLTDLLADLVALPTDLDNTVEFSRLPAPWVARANELKQTKLTTIDTTAELVRTLDAVKQRDVTLHEKETELEEQSVRVEMLEARLRDAGKRSARIAELEGKVHEAQDQAKRAQQAARRAEQEGSEEVERVREEMKRMGDEKRRGGASGELDDGAMGAGTKATVRRQEHRIASLQGAVRYLKDQNHRLRLPPPDAPASVRASLDWLHEPLVKPKPERQKRKEALQTEGRDALLEMLRMAARPSVVELTSLPETKLSWRPVRETSRWKIERRKEEWEGWKAWRSDIVGKADTPISRRTLPSSIVLPAQSTLSGKVSRDRPLQIVDDAGLETPEV